MMESRSYPDRTELSTEWMRVARSWLGTPYRHQACKKGVGADCVGLVAGVWSEVYGLTPQYRRDYPKDWAEVGQVDRLLEACRAFCCQRPNGENAFAGDIFLFRINSKAMAKHIAIYCGANRMIHAVDRRCVGEVDIQRWWHRRLVGVFAPPLQQEI